MFAKSVIALATVASFAVAAPLDKRGAPAGWAYGYLEDYDTYHTRYLAIGCQNQHNTQFFEDCCHPMLATENLKDNRKAYCAPSAAAATSASAAVKAQGSATPTASADVESESEYSKASPSSKPTSAPGEEHYATPAAATTAAPTTEAPAKASPSPSPSPAATQKSSGGGGQYQGGYATYFYQGGNAGACGTVHGDYDMIVAIDKDQWGSSSYGSGSSTCGRWLTITNTNNGRTVTAMVADVCPTCANSNSLDLSVGAFNAIASQSDGMVPISWSWA